MRFAFVRPSGYSPWGGDLKAISDIRLGLRDFGHESFVTSDPMEALKADSIFFIGTLLDQSAHLNFMRLMGREYGVIPFHEDHLLFSGASYGFAYYVSSILDRRVEEGHPFSLEALLERPHLIFYYDRMRPINVLQNFEFLKNAKTIIANSHTEQQTLFRDVPGCNAKVVYWAAGHAGDLKKEPTDAFLRFAGVKKGQYMIQIGRMTLRKNQLATLLATRDIDVPLVFIAMDHCEPSYEAVFFAAAQKWRKAPTLVISQHLTKSHSKGAVKVIPTPGGKILSKEMLLSAVSHAGLHIHPAFYELPGYTYLESARFGVPTIASSWGSLKDYFNAFPSTKYTLDDRIEYALPFDVEALKGLAEKKFGKQYSPLPFHPIYQRSSTDVTRDFLNQMPMI